MCMPFDSEAYEHLRRTSAIERSNEWARRLETKYGIVQPMAPPDEETPAPARGCSMATKAGMPLE